MSRAESAVEGRFRLLIAVVPAASVCRRAMPPPPSSRTLVPAPSASLPITKSANTEQAILDALSRLGPGAGGARALLEAPTAGPGVPTAVPGADLADRHATVSGDVVVTAVRR